MNENRGISDSFMKHLLNQRLIVLLILAVITLLLCFQLPKLKIDPNPEVIFPIEHPYLQIGKEYEEMITPPNALMCLI